MNIEFYSYTSDSESMPLFDITQSKPGRIYNGSMSNKIATGHYFTGTSHMNYMLFVDILRRRYTLRIEWGEQETSPEEAYRAFKVLQKKEQ